MSKTPHIVRIKEGRFEEKRVKRLIGAVLVVGLVSGCSTYFSKHDDVAFSGHGVLASYNQSMGKLSDSNRVGLSVSKRQIKPVDLASNRMTSKRIPLVDFNELSVEELKRSARPAADVPIFGETRSVVY